jgi:hypothetical protein
MLVEAIILVSQLKYNVLKNHGIELMGTICSTPHGFNPSEKMHTFQQIRVLSMLN